MKEKTYEVTLLVERKVKVKALDEIGAEREAMELHRSCPTTLCDTRVHQVRVKRRGYDSGFFKPFDAQ